MWVAYLKALPSWCVSLDTKFRAVPLIMSIQLNREINFNNTHGTDFFNSKTKKIARKGVKYVKLCITESKNIKFGLYLGNRITTVFIKYMKH